MARQPLEPLGHPVFRRFLLGQAVSRLGDFVFLVALPWQVVLLGGGAEQVALVLTAYLASQLALTLLGGVLVDRLARRAVVIASDAAQGALAALLAALAFSGGLSVEALAGFACAFGGAQAVAMPAIGAFLPETVPKRSVEAANALFQTALIGASAAGALAAGALLESYGTWAAFAVDAASFGVSAALLATLKAPGAAPAGGPPRGGLLAEVRAGGSYVARVPWLWMAIALFAAFNAAEASPRNVLLPVLVGVEMHGGAAGFAAVQASFMAGWLVGALLIVLLPPVRRVGAVSYAGVLATGATLGLVSVAPSVEAVAALLLAQGVVFGVIGTLWQQAIATLIDPQVRGRVISIDVVGSISLTPLATALVGSAAGVVGARSIFLWGGAVVAGLAVVGLASRRAREFRPAPATVAR